MMKLKHFKVLIIFGILFCQLGQNLYSQKTIVINEFMASNDDAFSDEIHGFHDWIELYNTSSKSINLKNYRIGKKKKFENNWVFPDTIINPGGRLILYCDKLDYISNVTKITAGGAGIENQMAEDSFDFYYVKTKDDFEIDIKLLSMNNFNFDTKIGLMIRKNLDANSPYAAALVGAPIRARYIYSWRHSDSIYSNTFETNEIKYPFVYFKLRRNKDSLFLLKCEQGTNLEYLIAAQILPFESDDYYFGVAFTSGDENSNSNAIINQLKINSLEVNISDLEFSHICSDSNLNKTNSQNIKTHRAIHTNFKLSKGGDKIYLFDDTGTQIDFVEYGAQISDISYGREFDTSDNFIFLEVPTPEAPNAGAKKVQASAPRFEPASGFYNTNIFVNLVPDEQNHEIYYTTDASTPGKNSNKFNGEPIEIANNTVLRAVAYASGDTLPSRVVTSTYFINEASTLPVVSLVVDSVLMWDPSIGIASGDNIYYKWKVPANFEFFENNSQDIYINTYNSACALRLNGNSTLTYPQKSFRLYAEDKYQSSSFDYNFFGNESANNIYEKLILRNGGNDWYDALIRDQLGHSLTQYLNNKLESSPIKNTLTFLNGKFYGIHQLMERHDKTYLSNKYKIETTSITMISADNPIFDQIKYGSPYEGATSWYKLYDTLEAFSIPNNSLSFEYFNNNIDLDNFFDYLIYNIYACNLDWADNNMLVWKSEELDNKWRWIVNDMDMTFKEPDIDNYYLLLSEKKTVTGAILKTILENTTLRDKFLNRFADLMNSVFLASNIHKKVDSIGAVLRPEINRQVSLYPEACANWTENIERIKDFATARADNQRQHILSYHDLSKTYNLNISSNINSYNSNTNNFQFNIKVNTLLLDLVALGDTSWTGIYFQGVPVNISVCSNDTNKYKFIAWELNGEFYSDSSSIVLDLHDKNIELNLKAIFQHNNFLHEDPKNNYNLNKKNTYNVKMSPNPVYKTALVNIYTPEPEQIKISIGNLNGEIISEFFYLSKAGENIFEYDFSKILTTSGVYYINISDNSNKNNFYTTNKFIYLH